MASIALPCSRAFASSVARTAKTVPPEAKQEDPSDALEVAEEAGKEAKVAENNGAPPSCQYCKSSIPPHASTFPFCSMRCNGLMTSAHPSSSMSMECEEILDKNSTMAHTRGTRQSIDTVWRQHDRDFPRWHLRQVQSSKQKSFVFETLLPRLREQLAPNLKHPRVSEKTAAVAASASASGDGRASSSSFKRQRVAVKVVTDVVRAATTAAAASQPTGPEPSAVATAAASLASLFIRRTFRVAQPAIAMSSQTYTASCRSFTREHQLQAVDDRDLQPDLYNTLPRLFPDDHRLIGYPDLSSQLQVRKSPIPNAGDCVFSRCALMTGFIAALYKGDHVAKRDTRALQHRGLDLNNSWLTEVRDERGEVAFYLDGRGLDAEHLRLDEDPHHVSKFVNAPLTKKDANAKYIYLPNQGNIVALMVTRDIAAGEEVVVWYGEDTLRIIAMRNERKGPGPMPMPLSLMTYSAEGGHANKANKRKRDPAAAAAVELEQYPQQSFVPAPTLAPATTATSRNHNAFASDVKHTPSISETATKKHLVAKETAQAQVQVQVPPPQIPIQVPIQMPMRVPMPTFVIPAVQPQPQQQQQQQQQLPMYMMQQPAQYNIPPPGMSEGALGMFFEYQFAQKQQQQIRLNAQLKHQPQ